MSAVRREDGFTIVEVLVAALILVVGAIATFGVLASATVNNQRAKGTQVALDKAQQELEALRSIPDEELALTATPPHSSEEGNPSYRVSNGKFAIKRGAPPSEYKSMVVKGGVLYPDETIEKAAVSPGPIPFTSGDVSGEVYRYIVWRNDASCSEESCPGEQDYKQIIVAVKLDPQGNGGSPGGYVEVQSDFVNPEHTGADNPIPGVEGVVTAQQFFLSDTPCTTSGETPRQEITGDHFLHNTLGACSDGPQTGATPGAPDALLTGAPPDPAPQDPTLPETFDYSSDYPSEFGQTPTAATSKGIQLRREDTSGCNYTPEGTTPQWQVHRWVTDPMPKEFVMTSGESTGSVTIDFFTRALSDSSYSGKLCIYLFVRNEKKSPPEDEFLADQEGGTYFWTFTPTQANSQWWQNEWHEVRLTMRFNGPKPIEEDNRLGVALSVDATTGADAIPILYDHPDYRSRIEVDTTTPLEGG